MGFQIRRRSENLGSRSHCNDAAAAAVLSRKEKTTAEVRVRASLICTSDNVDRLHGQMRASASPRSISMHVNTACSISSTRSRLAVQGDPWSDSNLKEAIELWKLNDEQVVRLQELQLSLQDCSHHFKYDPHIVLRYMTSPLGKDTEPLFRKMVQWRIDNRIDDVLDEYKPDPILLDYNTSAILKDYDHDGDPIYVERGGMTDGSGMVKRFSRDELLKYFIYTRELISQGAWIGEYEQRQGRKVKEVTVVYDLKGFNAHHLNPNVLNFFKEMMTCNSEKYPGPLKRAIIIRAPAIFRFGWSIVKHVFPQSARDKMIFAGKHPEKILSKYIDLAVLPPCICEGGMGEVAVGLPSSLEGGIIPDHRQPTRSYHASNDMIYQSQASYAPTEEGSIASSADTSFDTTM